MIKIQKVAKKNTYFKILFFSPTAWFFFISHKCEVRQRSQLERAKTVKIGKIKWPPDSSEEQSSDGQNLILTIERTNFPNPNSQSQQLTTAKIAAAQQELAQTIGSKTHEQEANGNKHGTCKQDSPLPVNKEKPQSTKSKNVKYQAKEDVKQNKCEKKDMKGNNLASLTYLDKSWLLRARKEMFGQKETLSKMTVPIVYEQIVADLNSPRCFRLRPKDKKKLRKFFLHIGIIHQDDVSGKRKSKIVEFVRENCPFYFMRIFPVIENKDIEFLGVSQKHITLGKTFHASETESSLQAVYTFEHNEVENVEGKGDKIEITVRNRDKPLSVKSAFTDSIIGLTKDIGLKKTQSLESLKERPASLQRHPKHAPGMNQFASSDVSLVDKFVTSIQLEVSPHSTDTDKPQEKAVTSEKLEVVRTKHSLSDFAEFFHKKDETLDKQGFLHPLKLAASKAVSLPDVAKLRKKTSQLRWSASPLKQPILSFKNVKIAQLALNCHMYIMSFMGDFSIGKRIRQRELVLNILKAGIEYKQLQDEIYCQLIMQTNLNKSVHQQSCFLGWRLFSIVSIFFPSTNMLQPYIFKYLQNCVTSKTINTIKDHSFLASFCVQVTIRAILYSDKSQLSNT